MYRFLTILCLAVVVSAAPQSGYNYQAVNQAFRPSSPISDSGIYSFQQSSPLTSFNVQSQTQQFQQFNRQSAGAQFATPVQATQYFAPVQQQNVFSGLAPIATFSQNTQANYRPQQQINYQPQKQVIVSKEIYIHAAPEETEEIGTDRSVEPGPLRKNYRIVFIKAPTQNLKLNLESLKRTQASNEEKTVIYVLSKKPDFANLQSQLSAVQTEQKAHKPEVFFIKYKTQEEANRAQEEIQAQYDSLGGSTSISNEGIAPVTSVIGGGRVNIGSIGTSFNGGSSGTSFNGGSSGTSFNGGSSGNSFNGNSIGTSYNGGSIGTSFNGGSSGTSFNGGSIGTSFNGGDVGSVGSSFDDVNVGAFNGGSNIVQTAGPIQQQQEFGQQSYQAHQGYLTSKKK